MIPAVIERCAGIDVGRKYIDVCLMVGEAQAEPTQETRRFSTLNEDLERMRQWRRKTTLRTLPSEPDVWRPIYNIHWMLWPDDARWYWLRHSQRVKHICAAIKRIVTMPGWISAPCCGMAMNFGRFAIQYIRIGRLQP